MEQEKENKTNTVKVTDSARYDGQDMKWTETMYPPSVIKKGTKLYHFSSGKIKEFLAKETCFFYSLYSFGHVYELEIPCDMTCRVSTTGEEVRVELNSDMELTYIGEKERPLVPIAKAPMYKRGKRIN